MQNPFKKIFVPEPQEIIKKAEKEYLKEKNKKTKKQVNKQKQKKQAVSRAITAYYKSIKSSLNQPQEFPSYKLLPEFYRKLYMLTENEDKTKKCLAKITTAKKLMKKIVFQEKEFLHKTNAGNLEKQARHIKGRLCSVIKSLKTELLFLKNTAKKMSLLPLIDEKLPTTVIAGCPNTGKSTLFRKLTGSKARVGAYPFTTTELNLGKYTHDFYTTQVIDTPGITEKPPEKLSSAEKKALLAIKKRADLGIFVIDPTEVESIKTQEKLLKKLKKEIPIKWIVYLSKTDICDKQKKIVLKKRFNAKTLTKLKKEIAKKAKNKLIKSSQHKNK